MMTASAAAYRATVALRLLCVFYCCPNSITPIKLFCLRLGSPQTPHPVQYTPECRHDCVLGNGF